MMLGKKNLFLAAAALLWGAMIAAGLGVLWRYENAPGPAAAPPKAWPAESRLERVPGRATLVMLAHPRCPCTRSSLGELALFMAQTLGRVEAHVLFYQPEDLAEDWAKTDLWHSAAIIPGVSVQADQQAVEARRFRAETSGQVLLYDAAGRLIFNGGITGSRGHAGDNAGRSAIVSLLNAGAADRDQTPVFGCPLFDRQCTDQEEEVQ